MAKKTFICIESTENLNFQAGLLSGKKNSPMLFLFPVLALPSALDAPFPKGSSRKLNFIVV